MPRKPEKIFIHKKINCVRLLVFEKFARNFKLGIAKIKGIVYTISRSKFPATCVMVSHMSHNTYTGLRVRKIHGNVRPHQFQWKTDTVRQHFTHRLYTAGSTWTSHGDAGLFQRATLQLLFFSPTSLSFKLVELITSMNSCMQAPPVPCREQVYPMHHNKLGASLSRWKQVCHSQPYHAFGVLCHFVPYRLISCKHSSTATNQKQHHSKRVMLSVNGTPIGNRTLDSAVRGRRLNRLTMRA